MAKGTDSKRGTDNILNEKCWYKNVCQYLKCDGCIRFTEMNYLMQNSGIPPAKQKPIQLTATTDNDKRMFRQLQNIKDNIIDFVDNGDNLYITSKSTGNGKTSWSLKLVLKYLDSIWAGNGLRVRALFVHVPSLLLSLKDFKNPVNPQFKRNLEECDLVVWDDIASTELSNYDYSQLLTYVDSRIMNERSNIYTGNIINNNQMCNVLGERLASRIFNCSKVIILDGKDMR